MQIVNIFLSIVCKPKRFLFCMFLFVVKWWEIPLEGRLVDCKWRTIRWLLVQEPGSVVSCVKFNIWKSLSHIPFDYHHERKELGCLSWFVNAGIRFHLLSRGVLTNLILRSSSWTFDALKAFSFTREQSLWRMNAIKPIVVNTFKWLFLSNREGFFKQ